MPSPEQIAAVYNFEAIFEKALQAVFLSADIKSYTSQFVARTGDSLIDNAAVAAGFQLLDFQKDRPRVEIFFTPGAGQGLWRELGVAGATTPVECAWAGQYRLEIVTAADIRVHSAFVVAVRFVMQTLQCRLNNSGLTFHAIAPFYKDGGTSPTIKAESGSFQTTMMFEINFSIQDDAWETIAS